MFTYHYYTCMSCYISLLHMHVMFSYPCYTCNPCSMLPYSCYVIVSCYWYGYSRYWTWELLICDMWNPTSIVPVILFPFPVILFLLYCSCFSLYCSMLSTELWSSYHVNRIMYCICSCYIVYLTYQIIKLTGVWGRLDGWLDHIGWMSGSIVCPTAGGRGSAGYRLLLMSIPLLF